jgi:hypothetical protein
MHIIVTHRNINNGMREDGDGCPIALAVKEKKLGKVFVTRVDVRYVSHGLLYYHRLSPKAIDFIKRFDHGRRVQPFSFETE